MLSTIAVALFTIAGAAPSSGQAALLGEHYATEEGVRIGPDMAELLARISTEFHRRTGRGIVITSGTRTSLEQADAMYLKIRLGQRLTRLYRDTDAAAEIQAAYRANQRASRARCTAAMARVIDAQMRRGLYISRHLHAGAVDVRSRDMSRSERRIFVEVVSRHREIELLDEGVPPHFHLEMR